MYHCVYILPNLGLIPKFGKINTILTLYILHTHLHFSHIYHKCNIKKYTKKNVNDIHVKNVNMCVKYKCVHIYIYIEGVRVCYRLFKTLNVYIYTHINIYLHI